MITTVMYCSWLNLKRDRVALGLSFILPIVFFSIFAVIFGGEQQGEGGVRPIRVAVVDLDQSEFSQKFIKALDAEEALEMVEQFTEENGQSQAFTEEEATKRVRKGNYPVALILPKDLQKSVGIAAMGTPLKVLYDSSNPMARHTLGGLMKSTAMNLSPSTTMEQGLEMLKRFGGPLTAQQQSAIDFAQATNFGASNGNGPGMDPVPTENIDVRSQGDEEAKQPNPVTYYAAGIGVMFLLFSMSGAGGGLLEEEESGTLDRLLSSQLGMNRLIIGKWLFFTFMGSSQLILMFVWGALVFDLPLFTARHLSGFLVITLPMACCGAAFGLLLATLSKSRTQLSGISTIVILIMSAIGGSMIPRFIMPSYMDTAAKFTINGWAIDGYLKVFWREDPSHSFLESLIYLAPEAGVLCLGTVGLLFGALFFAKRWLPS